LFDSFTYASRGLFYWIAAEAQDIVYTLAYASFFFVAAVWLLKRRDPGIVGKNKLNLPFEFLQKIKE
ncbi:MAG: hypothetical protein FWE48_04010, partial [Coriobacteriia bacterium]|nr:hypothetical protein [Coriobacteriia bacterium]